jgi:DNA-directed RNA polymerase specialized sigma24 family protein
MAMRGSLDDSTARLLHAATSGGQASNADLDLVLNALTRILHAKHPGLTASDIEDVVDRSIYLFIVAARKGQIDSSRQPAAYLIAIAMRAAVDAIRALSREIADEGEIETLVGDDELARSLDAAASAASVEEAMRRAAAAGDYQAMTVARAWLDAASRGETPTSRSVGATVRLSHTAVLTALDRFRSYFPDESSPP